jgi:stage II sporulation protein AA (anti-sigma F factor antagonist)
MELTVTSDDGNVLRLKLSGHVTQNDLAAPNDLMDEAVGVDGYARGVVLDMGEVSFIDSSGISWLLIRHKRFREAGGKLILHSIPPLVLDVLKVLRMDLVFNLTETESDALTALGMQGG